MTLGLWWLRKTRTHKHKYKIHVLWPLVGGPWWSLCLVASCGSLVGGLWWKASGGKSLVGASVGGELVRGIR